MNNNIKYKLANAMKECMVSSPVEKITVKEICDTCGVTRQTFYRNFQDKYDLINWYFDKILIESFHQMGEGSTVYESLVKKFEYIRMEHLFFKAAFKNDEQNNLKEHDFELIRQFYIDQIEGKSHRKISEKLLFQLEMYCQGSVFMTTQWVLDNKNFTPQELAGLLADAMPKELAHTEPRPAPASRYSTGYSASHRPARPAPSGGGGWHSWAYGSDTARRGRPASRPCPSCRRG